MTSGKDRLLELLISSGDDEAVLDLKILREEFTGEELDKAVMRRASGEPLAYILGYRHFFKECYKVCPGVLIPRADTEIAVESVLKFLGINDMATGDLLQIPSYGKPLNDIHFADLCTGTGCIGISAANEIVRAGGRAFGTLIDISDIAIDTADLNVRKQALKPEDLSVIRHDVLSSVPELEKLDFHYRVYEGYRKIADREPERVKRIDASETVDAIRDNIYKYLDELCRSRGI